MSRVFWSCWWHAKCGHWRHGQQCWQAVWCQSSLPLWFWRWAHGCSRRASSCWASSLEPTWSSQGYRWWWSPSWHAWATVPRRPTSPSSPSTALLRKQGGGHFKLSQQRECRDITVLSVERLYERRRGRKVLFRIDVSLSEASKFTAISVHYL